MIAPHYGCSLHYRHRFERLETVVDKEGLSSRGQRRGHKETTIAP